MLDIMPTSFVAAALPRKGKFVKLLLLDVFVRGENFLQNDILHFVFWFSQFLVFNY